jgi:LEA14-like dessication related protein
MEAGADERRVRPQLAAFWVLKTNVPAMRMLNDPVVTLDEVRLTRISLASLDLDVAIRVENPNPLGITLRELRFVVLCSAGQTDRQLASGNTGRVKITGNGSTVLHIPVNSQNAALISALATFITKGGVQVTIRGTATIDVVLFGWSVPFEKTLPVTMGQVAGSFVGRGSKSQ